MDERDEAFEELIERSSLGTPGARQLRRRTPRPQVDAVRRIVQLRHQMVHGNGPESAAAAGALVQLLRELGYHGQADQVLTETFPDGDDNAARAVEALGGTTDPHPAPVPARRPTGRLGVRCERDELNLGTWDVLSIMVSNATGLTFHNVTVGVSGPFQSDGRRSRVEALEGGATARFSFHVNATEGGRHVPVTVRTEYSYPDDGGGVRSGAQEDTVNVVVRPAAVDRTPAPAEQTVLYLAASPRNKPPLRSDLEMRAVKERLRLSRYRDRYRIEPYVAARFDDISQALVDHEPQVVHLSGHGDRDGNLLIEDANGDSTAITPEGLANLFGQHKDTIRCVLLNTRYSARLAEAISARTGYVVGMRYPIGDEAAIEFSVGFYLALFAGRTVPEAYARGQSHLTARPDLAPHGARPLLFQSDAAP